MNKISTVMKMTVPFYDTDPMNIVWHGNYIKYLENARCHFFKQINYTYNDMYNEGIMYPIAKLDIKYSKSAYFSQEIDVIVRLIDVEPAIIFKYKIQDSKTKETICTAKTMQIGVDIKTKKTVYKISDNFRKKLNEYNN